MDGWIDGGLMILFMMRMQILARTTVDELFSVCDNGWDKVA